MALEKHTCITPCCCTCNHACVHKAIALFLAFATCKIILISQQITLPGFRLSWRVRMTVPCSYVCINSYMYACMCLLAVTYTVASRSLVPLALAHCTIYTRQN